MPSNKQQALELQCRRNIDKLLTQGLASTGELSLSMVVREAILQFPVGATSVKNFIQEFYIDTGLVKLENGMLYPGGDS